MVRAAKAARVRVATAPRVARLVALRAFDVWHREQLVRVPPGEVRDAQLVATLGGIRDGALLEWQA